MTNRCSSLQTGNKTLGMGSENGVYGYKERDMTHRSKIICWKLDMERVRSRDMKRAE